MGKISVCGRISGFLYHIASVLLLGICFFGGHFKGLRCNLSPTRLLEERFNSISFLIPEIMKPL